MSIATRQPPGRDFATVNEPASMIPRMPVPDMAFSFVCRAVIIPKVASSAMSGNASSQNTARVGTFFEPMARSALELIERAVL
jgi:hypothetical protein